MKDVLAFLIESLVDNPKEVLIEEEHDDDAVRFNLTIADSDYPRVIGSHGLTIKAITGLVRTYHAKTSGGNERV
ncbi:hypothetical protein A3D08_03515, partial [Candidatus Roizmanbacteria bacterium RIFCSPHIGHO2_02_FULL_43_11]